MSLLAAHTGFLLWVCTCNVHMVLEQLCLHGWGTGGNHTVLRAHCLVDMRVLRVRDAHAGGT